MSDPRPAVSAFAPASVGNVAVGFDLMGHALAGIGDRVTIRAGEPGSGIRIGAIRGADAALPDAVDDNTAGRAVRQLCRAIGQTPDLLIDIDKGIPLASGLGGSAASAVAAVVAANAWLDAGFSPSALYPFALAGEAVASGAAHGDNVGPQLLGGLVLATADRLVPIPVPAGLTAAVVHPEHRVATRDARECLVQPFDLATVVRQTQHLALVLSGCYDDDPERIAAGLSDVMVEPRRAHLIPGFDAVRAAALEAGALGASISGAGPTVFAWFTDEAGARTATEAMQQAFTDAGLAASAHISPVDAPGARVVSNQDGSPE